jgi:hypothetical protein
MLHAKPSFEQSLEADSKLFSDLKLGHHLRKAGFRKAFGSSCLIIVRILLLLAFQQRNWFRLLQSSKKESLPGKDVIYRFLNTSSFAWRTFLTSIATDLIARIQPLTSSKRVRVFVVDDTLYSRSRSKAVELLSWVHDHTTNQFVRGFTMLTLGWSDGSSFVPLDFALMSSADPSKQLQQQNEQVDYRSHGGKRRKEAQVSKPENVVSMLKRAINQGIQADYVLMDSWFTTESLMTSVVSESLHVIGRMKKNNHRLIDEQGQPRTLEELYKRSKPDKKRNIQSSVVVKMKHGLPIKIVFVMNRNDNQDWIALATTDLELATTELVRIYGIRWAIETFFKCTKSHLKLAKEFQSRSYDAMIAHTTIVFIRYLFLVWENRKSKDPKSLGDLFFWYADEAKDMDFKTSLQLLFQFTLELLQHTHNSSASANLFGQLRQFIAGLPRHIQALLPELRCES